MFIDTLSDLNNNDGALSINNETSSYTYDDFMEDMLLIESSIFNLINSNARVIQETAIHNLLLEDTIAIPEKTGADQTESFIQKAKKICNKIIEKFLKMLDSIYNVIYKEVVLNTTYIKKHKDEIMKNNMIYSKVKASIEKDGETIKLHNISVSEPDITTYRLMLSPNFIEPLTSEKDLDKYMENGKLDTEKLYKYYMYEILGDKVNISIDNINSKKSNLLKALDSVYDEVKTRKKKIISLQRRTPNNLTPEDLKKFQENVLAKTQSLKIYNKVLLTYLKEDVSILKKYIKNGSTSSASDSSTSDDGGEK